jgi:hypothetical protein
MLKRFIEKFTLRSQTNVFTRQPKMGIIEKNDEKASKNQKTWKNRESTSLKR